MACTENNVSQRRAHFTYIWKIKDAPLNREIQSPEFTVQSMEMTKWYLRLIIYGYTGNLTFSIVRAKEDGGPVNVEIEFELSLLDSNRSPLIINSSTENFQKNKKSTRKKLWSKNIFCESKAEFYPNDTLTVRCRIWKTRTELLKSELCFASTHFDVCQCYCLWAVKGFTSLQQGEKRVRILNTARKECPQLILTLYLDIGLFDKEIVYIHLEAPHITRKFCILAEIAVLDSEGKPANLKRTAEFLNTDRKSRILSNFQTSKLMSDKATLLSDNVLVLQCGFQFIFDIIWSRIEDYKLMDYSDSKTAQREQSETHFDELNTIAVCPFKEMVNKFKEDGTLSDVCLRSDNISFPVHKLVLSSRSPVFRTMFTKDMREKTSKCIDIPDLDVETMSRLLLYIYEDKVQELTWEAAANLFEAADRFELLTLKVKCSNFLMANLTESNVCEILVLADMHHDENLRKSVQGFILSNPKIIRSDAWKDFKHKHSKLALETTEQIIYDMKSPSH